MFDLETRVSTHEIGHSEFLQRNGRTDGIPQDIVFEIW